MRKSLRKKQSLINVALASTLLLQAISLSGCFEEEGEAPAAGDCDVLKVPAGGCIDLYGPDALCGSNLGFNWITSNAVDIGFLDDTLAREDKLFFEGSPRTNDVRLCAESGAPTTNPALPLSQDVTINYALESSAVTRTIRVLIEGAELSVSASADRTQIEEGESVTLTAAVNPSSGNLVYSWTPADSVSSPNLAVSVASPRRSTRYEVTVRDLATGKTATATTAEIIVVPATTTSPDDPIAQFTGYCIDQSPQGKYLVLDGGASTPLDDLEFHWDIHFNDSNRVLFPTAFGLSAEYKRVSFPIPSGGPFPDMSVTLTVRKKNNHSKTDSLTLDSTFNDTQRLENCEGF